MANETTPFLGQRQNVNHWNKLKQTTMFIRVVLVLGLLVGLVFGVYVLQSEHDNTVGMHSAWQHGDIQSSWNQDMEALEVASKKCLSTISPIPANYYIERQQRLAKTLRKEVVDALVIEPSPAMIYYANLDWSRTERPFLVVFTLNKTHHVDPTTDAGAETETDTIAVGVTGLQMTIVTPLFEETRARQQLIKANLPDTINVKMVSWIEHESPYEVVKQVLGDSRMIQIEPSTRLFVADGIQSVMMKDKAKDVKVTMASEPIQQLRMVKSFNEIDIMRCANRLTHLAVRTVKKHVAVGMTEDIVANKMTEALDHAGLVKTWVVALVDDNAAFPHGQPGKLNRVQNGSLVLIDTGGEVYGYQSDMTRTFFVGDKQPDSANKIQHAWHAVRAAQAEVKKTTRNGKSCAEVDLTARKVIETAGFGPHFTHRLGHGIGLEMHEDPYMNQGNTECIIRPGYTFSVEPGIYVPTQFGIRLEDIAYIGQDGYLYFMTDLSEDPWTP